MYMKRKRKREMTYALPITGMKARGITMRRGIQKPLPLTPVLP
jgi:hypothetical protein